MAEYMWTTHAPLGRTVRGNGVGVGRGGSRTPEGANAQRETYPTGTLLALDGRHGFSPTADALIQKGRKKI